MSAEAVGWVFRFSPYDGATFTVHVAIADSVSDQHGYVFWMRQTVCAAKARVSRSAVNTAIRRMVDDGLLVLVEERPGGANRYAFVMPQGLPSRFDGALPAQIRRVSSVTTPHFQRDEESLQGKGGSTPEIGGVVTDDTLADSGGNRSWVSSQTTSGVATGDTWVSSQTTGGVVTDDTYPKETQDLSQTSSSAAVAAETGAVPEPLEEEELIAEALKVLADRHLARRQGGPLQSLDRWMAATITGLHKQHDGRATLLITDEPGHTATSLADALEPDADAAQRQAREQANRRRSCELCGGTGLIVADDSNVVFRCDHGGAQ